MVYIIGSGLSAMAAAAALVQRGCRPTILDTGLSPDPDALILKARLAASEPEDWKPEDLQLLQRTGPVAVNGIPRKRHFGSDFTYRNVNLSAGLDLHRASAFRSFAAGGFSNVWGAVIQPMSKRDLADWPIAPQELAPHYDAAHILLKHADIGPAAHDVSTHDSAVLNLRPSTQTEQLKADLDASRRELAREGIRFDYARLAVQTGDRDGHGGCRYCGMCLYGCPYDCRYAADSTLKQLIKEGKVRYRPGIIVDKLSNEKGKVRIEGRSLGEGSPVIHDANQVFVAAGLLETSRIVLSSLGLYGVAMQVKHSDIFTLPILRYSKAAGIFHEKLHALCQLVAEIEDESACAYPVRLQFYGYNDLYLRLLAHKLGLFAWALMPAFRTIVARLFVIFGYLHSSVSSSLELTLSRGGSTLRLEGRPNPEALRIVRAIARKLLKIRKQFRAIPLAFQVRLDLPGGGYHSGGIFPMRPAPGDLQTDRWGSLPSLPGVHLIDATILPTVPAGPLAFTVMANAHRIASECPVPHAE